MTPLSRHDRVLLAVTVAVVMFGILGATAKRRIARIRDDRRRIERVESDIRAQRAKIDARDEWMAQYDRVRDRMPVVSTTEQVEAKWFSMMYEKAQQAGLDLPKLGKQAERERDGVCLLPLEARDWKGTLQSLVDFIVSLEAEGAMFEISRLHVKPVPKEQGYLNGSFTLTCAFLRSDDEPAAPLFSSPAPSSPSPAPASGKDSPSDPDAGSDPVSDSDSSPDPEATTP